MRSASLEALGIKTLALFTGLSLFTAQAQAAEPETSSKTESKAQASSSKELEAFPFGASFGGEHIAKKDKARAIYQRAIQAIFDKKNEEAEVLLAQAFELDRTYDLAANLGDLELKNQKPELAAKHLLFAMSRLPSGVSNEFTERLRKRFEEAQGLVGAFRINVQPHSATVVIDGQNIAEADLRAGVFVKPGEHLIQVSEQGFEARERRVSVSAGEARDLLIELDKSPPKMPLAPLALRQSPPTFVSGTRHLVLFSTLATSAVVFGFAKQWNDQTNADFKKLAADSDKIERMQGPDACVPGEEPHLESACQDLKKLGADINERTIRYQTAYAVSGIFFAGFLAYGAHTLWKDTKTTVLPTVTRNAGALVLTRVW